MRKLRLLAVCIGMAASAGTVLAQGYRYPQYWPPVYVPPQQYPYIQPNAGATPMYPGNVQQYPVPQYRQYYPQPQYQYNIDPRAGGTPMYPRTYVAPPQYQPPRVYYFR